MVGGGYVVVPGWGDVEVVVSRVGDVLDCLDAEAVVAAAAHFFFEYLRGRLEVCGNLNLKARGSFSLGPRSGVTELRGDFTWVGLAGVECVNS